MSARRFWASFVILALIMSLLAAMGQGILLLYSMEWTQRVIEGIFFDALAR